jgi:hypothetical protein
MSECAVQVIFVILASGIDWIFSAGGGLAAAAVRPLHSPHFPFARLSLARPHHGSDSPRVAARQRRLEKNSFRD